MNHLQYYKKALETGKLLETWQVNGLCGETEVDEGLLKLFEPTDENKWQLRSEDLCAAYWG